MLQHGEEVKSRADIQRMFRQAERLRAEAKQCEAESGEYCGQWKRTGDPDTETRMLEAAKQADKLNIQAETLFGKAVRMYHALIFG